MNPISRLPISLNGTKHTSSPAPASCAVCDFTPATAATSYRGNIKLFYTASPSRGIWSLGPDRILKERPAVAPMTEVETLRFIKKKTSIPVANVISSWIDSAGNYFVLMDRLPGQSLETAWPTLPPAQRERVVEQTARYFEQLRGLTADRMKTSTGAPVMASLFCQNGPKGQKQEAVWEYISRRSSGQDEGGNGAPRNSPYMFTHGDPSICNIMVEQGADSGEWNVTGIVDWEWSGYFPVWWEYVAASVPVSDVDREWKRMLRGKMQVRYEEEVRWWKQRFASDGVRVDED